MINSGQGSIFPKTASSQTFQEASSVLSNVRLYQQRSHHMTHFQANSSCAATDLPHACRSLEIHPCGLLLKVLHPSMWLEPRQVLLALPCWGWILSPGLKEYSPSESHWELPVVFAEMSGSCTLPRDFEQQPSSQTFL